MRVHPRKGTLAASNNMPGTWQWFGPTYNCNAGAHTHSSEFWIGTEATLDRHDLTHQRGDHVF